MKKFLSVDGVIRGEVREGEAPRQFVLDAMGSVVEVYQAGSLKADASYTADGDMLSASWNMSSYSFRWLGGWGYRYTGKDWMNTYVRARHYSTSDGAWSTVDPLWPDEAAYRYVEGRVMGAVDYAGRNGSQVSNLLGIPGSDKPLPWPLGGPPPERKGEGIIFDDCDENLKLAVRKLCANAMEGSKDTNSRISKCISRTSQASNQLCSPYNSARSRCIQDFCNRGYISCRKEGSEPLGDSLGYCKNADLGNDNLGTNNFYHRGNVYIRVPYGASNFQQHTNQKPYSSAMLTVMHEISHACGIAHGKYGHRSNCQCSDIYACCTFEVMGKNGRGENCVKAMKTYIGRGGKC